MVKTHGADISRQAARGAMHALKEESLDVGQTVTSIITNIIRISNEAGVFPEDSIFGVAQGIIQGAAEIHADFGSVTQYTINAVREVSTQIGLTRELAVAKTIEGLLSAADTISPETLIEVKKSLP